MGCVSGNCYIIGSRPIVMASPQKKQRVAAPARVERSATTVPSLSSLSSVSDRGLANFECYLVDLSDVRTVQEKKVCDVLWLVGMVQTGCHLSKSSAAECLVSAGWPQFFWMNLSGIAGYGVWRSVGGGESC